MEKKLLVCLFVRLFARCAAVYIYLKYCPLVTHTHLSLPLYLSWFFFLALLFQNKYKLLFFKILPKRLASQHYVYQSTIMYNHVARALSRIHFILFADVRHIDDIVNKFASLRLLVL